MMNIRIWTELKAFILPNLAKHDIQFQICVDLGSDHLLIEISIGPGEFRGPRGLYKSPRNPRSAE